MAVLTKVTPPRPEGLYRVAIRNQTTKQTAKSVRIWFKWESKSKTTKTIIFPKRTESYAAMRSRPKQASNGGKIEHA